MESDIVVYMAALPDRLPAVPVELRACQLEHLDAVMTAIEMSHTELARWLPWADPMPSRQFERGFIIASMASFDADDKWGYFLFEPETGELVGSSGLWRHGNGRFEIGYWVRSDRTGRGYATAAAGALTAAAFRYLAEAEWVVIRMDQANAASAAVPPKVGYLLEGEDPVREVEAPGQMGQGWIWAKARSSPED